MWRVAIVCMDFSGLVRGSGFEVLRPHPQGGIAYGSLRSNRVYVEAEAAGDKGVLTLVGYLSAQGTWLTWLDFAIIKKGVSFQSDLSQQAGSFGVGAMQGVLREVGKQLHRAGWTRLVLDFDRISGARGQEHRHGQMAFALNPDGALPTH